MRRVMRVLFSPGLRGGFKGLRVGYLGKRVVHFCGRCWWVGGCKGYGVPISSIIFDMGDLVRTQLQGTLGTIGYNAYFVKSMPVAGTGSPPLSRNSPSRKPPWGHSSCLHVSRDW